MKKPKSSGCRCSSKTHGNPKHSNGICYRSGEVRPSVRERIEGKKLCKEWQRFLEDESD